MSSQASLYQPDLPSHLVQAKGSEPINVSSTSAISLEAELASVRNKVVAQRKVLKEGESAFTFTQNKLRESKKTIWDSSNKGVFERLKCDIVLSEDAAAEEEYARSQMTLKRKARRYRRLKHGLTIDETNEILIDFETGDEHDRGASSDESEDEGAEDEVVEYTDEFGRTRTMKKSRIPDASILRAQVDHDYEPPANIIYDPSYMPTYRIDEAQARAFEAASEAPPVAFYDASKEVRNKGVGFYNFSQNMDEREAQLKALKESRKQTELSRAEATSSEVRRRETLRKRRDEIQKKRDMNL